VGAYDGWEPSKRKKALEWVLFTTGPVTDAASARERIEAVSGALGGGGVSHSAENGVRPRAAATAQRPGTTCFVGFSGDWGGASAAVAPRSTPRPGDTREAGGEPEFLETVVRFRGGSADRVSAEQFWRAVAGWGGFLGRKGEGDPGWQTLWRGWQRLQDLCWGLPQLSVPSNKCG